MIRARLYESVAHENLFGSVFDSLKASEQCARRAKSEITLWVSNCVIRGESLLLYKMISSSLGTTCKARWGELWNKYKDTPLRIVYILRLNGASYQQATGL